MLLIKVISVALATLAAVMVLRRQCADFAWAAAAAGGILILTLLWEPLGEVLAALESLGEGAGLAQGHVQLILKVMGVTLLGEWAASFCREAGEEMLAKRVSLACHVALMAMAMPLLLSVVEVLRQWSQL